MKNELKNEVARIANFFPVVTIVPSVSMLYSQGIQSYVSYTLPKTNIQVFEFYINYLDIQFIHIHYVNVNICY